MSGPREYPESVLRAYSTKGKLSAFPVQSSKQNYIYNVRAFNNSGSSQTVGILTLGISTEYKLWQYVNAGPTYTDVTSTIASGVNIFTGTNNDGFVFQFNKVPGLLGLTISTAQTGGTFTYGYWSGAAFTTLTTLEVPVYTSTGDVWIVAQPAQQWVKGGPAALDQGKYSLFVQSTTGPAGAVAITGLWCGHFMELYQGVPNNAAVQVSFPDSKPYCTSSGAGIIPYFSTANAANQVGVYLSITG